MRTVSSHNRGNTMTTKNRIADVHLIIQMQCDFCNAMSATDSRVIQEKDFGEYWNELRMELPQIDSSFDSNLLRWPVFVKPTRSNRRITHQERAFLLWGINSVI